MWANIIFTSKRNIRNITFWCKILVLTNTRQFTRVSVMWFAMKCSRHFLTCLFHFYSAGFSVVGCKVGFSAYILFGALQPAQVSTWSMLAICAVCYCFLAMNRVTVVYRREVTSHDAVRPRVKFRANQHESARHLPVAGTCCCYGHHHCHRRQVQTTGTQLCYLYSFALPHLTLHWHPGWACILSKPRFSREPIAQPRVIMKAGNFWQLSDLRNDLDVGSGHTAHLHVSLIDFYLHTEFRSNHNNFLWTERTDGRAEEHWDRLYWGRLVVVDLKTKFRDRSNSCTKYQFWQLQTLANNNGMDCGYSIIRINVNCISWHFWSWLAPTHWKWKIL